MFIPPEPAVISEALNATVAVCAELLYVTSTERDFLVALAIEEVHPPYSRSATSELAHHNAVVVVTVLFLATSQTKHAIYSEAQTIKVENGFHAARNCVFLRVSIHLHLKRVF